MPKKSLHILSRIAGLLIVVMISVPVIVQIPFIQTRIIQFVSESLEGVVDARITVGGFHLKPDGAIRLTDILVIDKSPYTDSLHTWAPADTLLEVGQFSTTFSLKGILKHEGIHLGRVSLRNASFHLVSEPNRYRNNLNRIMGVIPEENDPPQEGFPVFDTRRIRLDNIRFRMNNYLFTPNENDQRSPYGIHFENMDANVVKMRIHALKFAYGRMSGILDGCRIKERRGYEINHLDAKFAAGSGLTSITDFHLQDSWSDVHLDNVTMDYTKGEKAFLNFIEEVKIGVSSDNAGMLDVRTISGVCGALYGNESVYDIKKIRAEGPVCDINVKKIVFQEKTTDVKGEVSCRITGLPSVRDMYLDGEVSNVRFAPDRACDFTAWWAKNFKLMLKGGDDEFVLNGTVKGHLRDLGVDVVLESATCGSVDAKLMLLDILEEGKDIKVQGNIRSSELAAGKLFGIDALGTVSMKTNASMRLIPGLPDFNIDTLDISKLSLLGYDYSDISARAYKEGGKMLLRLESADPNVRLRLLANGSGSYENGDMSMFVAADLDSIDLHEMNLDTRGEVSKASSKVDAKFFSTREGVIDGNIKLDKLEFTDGEGLHKLGTVTVYTHNQEGCDSLSLKSAFADASYSGTSGFRDMIRELKAATAGKSLPSLFPAAERVANDTVPTGKYHVRVDFHNCWDALQCIKPGCFIDDSTCVKFALDSGRFDASIKSRRLAINGNYLKNVRMCADNSGDRLAARIESGETKVAEMMIADAVVAIGAANDSLDLRISYCNFDDSGRKGFLNVDGKLSRDDSDSLFISARQLPSTLAIGQGYWEMGESFVTYGKKTLGIKNFLIRNGEQRVRVNGAVSANNHDELSLNIDKLDLSLMSKFSEKLPESGGILSGYTKLVSPLKGQYKIMAKLDCDSLSLMGQDAGKFTLAGKWNENKQTIDFFLNNRLGGRECLYAYASLDPLKQSVTAELSMDRMNPAVAAPFLTGIFDEIDGNIDGKIKAEGKLKEIDISADGLRMNELGLRLAATGAKYILDGPIGVDETGVTLDGISISDGSEGMGKLNGKISYNRLKNISIDARLNFDELTMIDCDERSGQSIYGQLRASGSASIRGPISRMDIDAKVTTAGEGNVHVPLGTSTVSTNSDLLTFVEVEKERDFYEMLMESRNDSEKQNKKGEVSISAEITATPGVRAFVEIDKATGNMLTASGSGTVNLYMNPSREILNLDGKYDLSGGKYNFQSAGIINKEFSIQNGSSLTFNGPVMNTELDVTAQYKLKTSLNTLIADTSSVSTRRPVICGIHISDDIKNLRFGFSIDVPDLDPSTKAKVESALNTEDKVEKQFVSLLLFGTFLPSEQSGVVNSTNILYSNVSEVMSGQINAILQKLDIPVDLGFGYQQGEGGTDIFDVAVSTQLFNNRVIVNGSVGNRKYKTSSSQNGDVVGDLDIEIKLDKSGQLRATLFSHSADEFTNYLDNSQRNGIGVSFQREFDRIKNIFKKKIERSDSLKVIKVPADQSSPASRRSR